MNKSNNNFLKSQINKKSNINLVNKQKFDDKNKKKCITPIIKRKYKIQNNINIKYLYLEKLKKRNYKKKFEFFLKNCKSIKIKENNIPISLNEEGSKILNQYEFWILYIDNIENLNLNNLINLINLSLSFIHKESQIYIIKTFFKNKINELKISNNLILSYCKNNNIKYDKNKKQYEFLLNNKLTEKNKLINTNYKIKEKKYYFKKFYRNKQIINDFKSNNLNSRISNIDLIKNNKISLSKSFNRIKSINLIENYSFKKNEFNEIITNNNEFDNILPFNNSFQNNNEILLNKINKRENKIDDLFNSLNEIKLKDYEPKKLNDIIQTIDSYNLEIKENNQNNFYENKENVSYNYSEKKNNKNSLSSIDSYKLYLEEKAKEKQKKKKYYSIFY